MLLAFRKQDDFILCRYSLEKLRIRALCLTVMLPDNGFFRRWFPVSPCFLLRFIKKAELPSTFLDFSLDVPKSFLVR